jgi:hypothetical protein
VAPNELSASSVERESHSYVGIIECQSPFGMLIFEQLGSQRANEILNL